MQYHRRWTVSRPCSEWERVGAIRNNHQASEDQSFLALNLFPICATGFRLIERAFGLRQTASSSRQAVGYLKDRH
jgi:hypothetical protein